MSESTFLFPASLDDFEPTLLNDITPVNANHVLDLRTAVLEIERAIIGPTTMIYLDTSIIQNNDSLKAALQKLDYFTSLLASELDLITDGYFDGYSSRLIAIEDQLKAHREAVGDLDSYGFNVHGAEGEIVGTLNQQTIFKKIIDSTNQILGPKLILRAHPSETTGTQLEVYDYLGNLKSWIDGNGNARFKDITIDGYTIQAGVDLIENSLKVDGYSILGRADSPTDYLEVNGPSTFNGSLILNGDLTLNSANATLEADFVLTIDSPDAYFTGSVDIVNGLSVRGPITFGSVSSSEAILIQTSVSQNTGTFYVGGFRADGGKFRVENDETRIKSSSLIIESQDISIDSANIFLTGSLTIDGYQVGIGNFATSETNLLDLNGQTTVNGTLIVNQDQLLTGTLVVGQNLQVDSGVGSFQTIESSNFKLNQATEKRFIPVASEDGYLTLTRPKYYQSIVVDSYSYYREDSQEVNSTPGFYQAKSFEEIFVNTLFSSLTIYLPQNPLLGDKVKIIDFAGSFDVNKATISPPSGVNPVSHDFTESDFNITTNEINWPGHGLTQNEKLGYIRSINELPAGLKQNSFFYADIVDASNIRLLDGIDGNVVQIISTPTSGNYTLLLNTIDGNSSLDLTTSNQIKELIFDGANWRTI